MLTDQTKRPVMDDIRLEQTCGACPEQYDAYLNDELVGYLRLRHGHYTVRVPYVEGTVVYEAYPKGDGLFENDERDFYLDRAKMAILLHLDKQKPIKIPTVKIEHQLTAPEEPNQTHYWLNVQYENELAKEFVGVKDRKIVYKDSGAVTGSKTGYIEEHDCEVADKAIEDFLKQQDIID